MTEDRVAELIIAGSDRRPKTLILDIYGRYAAQFQGWIPVARLVSLMELLGIDEQAVRSAMSRMSRRGLLISDPRNGVRGYQTTDDAEALFAEADARIYAIDEPALLDDGWVLVSFSMPEQKRGQRHALRSQLTWHGMGIVSAGLWIGPARVRSGVTEAIGRLGLGDYVDMFVARHDGLGDLTDLVARAWDLDALAGAYRHFIDSFEPVLAEVEKRAGLDPHDAFATYTLTLHAWRKFPYLDPGLPTELLPPGWPGGRAAELFRALRAALEPTSMEFAAAMARPDN